MASTSPSSNQDKAPIGSENSLASSSAPRMSSFPDESSKKILLDGRTVRLVIYSALMEDNRQIWLAWRARFCDVANELVTMNSSGEFVILQPHWGPKPHWTVADANSVVESTCQVLYAVFMSRPVRYIVGLVRTQKLDYPTVIFEPTERHSMTISQAVTASNPTLDKLAKSISRYSNGQDVSDHLIDYDELESANSLTFPTALIIMVDKPPDDLLSDLPSNPVPIFLQIPLAYCEQLLTRAFNLNLFSFQMIHLSRAIRHLLICLVQRIGDAYEKENHGLEDAPNPGGDPADILRLALLYSRALQALLERLNGIIDRLESTAFIQSKIQNSIGGVFNDICGDYPGSISVRYSHTRLEELAKMDREEELQARDDSNRAGTGTTYSYPQPHKGSTEGTPAPPSPLWRSSGGYVSPKSPDQTSRTQVPSALNLDHRIAQLDEGAARMIAFHSGTRPDAPISLLEALEGHYRRFPNMPVIKIRWKPSRNGRKLAMDNVECGLCPLSGKFQKIADHIVCEHFKLTLWYCGLNSCPISVPRKSELDRHRHDMHSIARPRKAKAERQSQVSSPVDFPSSPPTPSFSPGPGPMRNNRNRSRSREISNSPPYSAYSTPGDNVYWPNYWPNGNTLSVDIQLHSAPSHPETRGRLINGRPPTFDHPTLVLPGAALPTGHVLSRPDEGPLVSSTPNRQVGPFHAFDGYSPSNFLSPTPHASAASSSGIGFLPLPQPVHRVTTPIQSKSVPVGIYHTSNLPEGMHSPRPPSSRHYPSIRECSQGPMEPYPMTLSPQYYPPSAQINMSNAVPFGSLSADHWGPALKTPPSRSYTPYPVDEDFAFNFGASDPLFGPRQ